MPIEYLDEQPSRIEYSDQPAAAPAAPQPPQTFGDRLRNARETLSASTTGIIHGIPVVGPMLTRGVETVATGGMLPKETYTERLQREHPVASTVGEVTGGVVSTVPAMRAFPALGGGSSMWGRIPAGAALGGTDAAVRSGGDPTSIAVGAGIGGAAPAIGEILAPLGSAAASGARWVADRTPGLRGTLAPRVAPAASEVIHDTAERGYDMVRNARVTYSQPEIAAMVAQTQRRLNHLGAYADGTGDVAHEALDRLLTRPNTPAGLYSVVDELREQGARLGGKGKLAADSARQQIEEFVEGALPPGRVTSGHAQARLIGPTMADNRANWRAYKNAQAVQGKIDEAALKASSAYSGLNADNNVRQRITSLLNSPKASRFLTANERAQLQDVARGSWGANAARYGSSLLGGGGGLATAVTGLGAGGVLAGADAVQRGEFDPWRAAAAVGAGFGLRKGATAITRGAAREAEAAIRASAPVSRRMMAQGVMPRTQFMPQATRPSISAMQSRDEIARLLALQAEREAVQ